MAFVPCKKGYSRNKETNRCRKKTKTSKKTSKKKVSKKNPSKKKVSKKKVSKPKPKKSKKNPSKKKVSKPEPKKSKKNPLKKNTSKSKRNSSKKTTSQKKTSTSWKDMIKNWKSGHKLPVIKSGVYWETSSVHSGGASAYLEKRVRTSSLPMGLPANPAPFASKLKKSRPVAFLNLGKSAVLVAPPNKGLNFSHIGTFHKNASSLDIKAFWRKVATEVEKFIRKGTKVYVSTHGNGVDWLHVRIEKHPKYYTSALKNT